jgi:hypothetical protein
MSTWAGVLASAMVGTARTGRQAGAVLDAAAAQALHRRAGVALVPAVRPPAPAPVDSAPTVGPAAAARIEDLLALDRTGRTVTRVRNLAGRLELLTEWLGAAAAAGRRLPAELVPALIDVARRHAQLRPSLGQVAGPLAGWLAAQRPEWSFAASAPAAEPTVDAGPDGEWELGSSPSRVAYLTGLRQRDPARARGLLEEVWAEEPPEHRAVLLAALATELSIEDETLLERALDDRRRQVREVALDLLSRLPGTGYADRMVTRAQDCVRLTGPGRIGIRAPATCDRSMRRDGIAGRPPAGTGERAWWLEEILARTPLSVWPEPRRFLGRGVDGQWLATVLRGLARAAASQRDGAWAAALVDPLTPYEATNVDRGRRQLLEALYEALPADELAARASAVLRHGLVGTAAVGGMRIFVRFPRPWPPAVAEAVFAALDAHPWHTGASAAVFELCELAALRLPADLAPRAVSLLDRVRASNPSADPPPAAEQLATVVRYRYDMLQELT